MSTDALQTPKDYEVKNIPLENIRPYDDNPRLNDESVHAVVRSIQAFGWQNPIVVDADNVIICGHTRYKAAGQMGLKIVPVHVASDLTPDEVRAFRIADNKTGLLSAWDFPKLKDELLGLKDEDFDLSLTGFSVEELSDIIDPKIADVKESGLGGDGDGSGDKEPITQRGDLYILGESRLICGDATSDEDIARLMNGEKADMVLTDPPYGMGLDTDFTVRMEGKGNKYDPIVGDNGDFKPELITTIFEHFGECEEIFIFGADYFAELMLRHDWFGFLSSGAPGEARNRMHPTQKPTTLLFDIIKQWGEDRYLIVDPYAGSGTTLMAAEQLNRRCYAVEIEPKNCDIIVKRWEELTGKKAVLERRPE